MRFKEAYEGWHAGTLTQIEAARLLGLCDRCFRCNRARYEECDLDRLIDKRIEQVSHLRACGWNAKSVVVVSECLQLSRQVDRVPEEQPIYVQVGEPAVEAKEWIGIGADLGYATAGRERWSGFF